MRLTRHGPNVAPQEYLRHHSLPVSCGCWIWMRATEKSGYGSMWHDNEMFHAHRFSYKTFKGDIPAGMFVCHICDVKSCVNPDHLFLGTPRYNIVDTMMKGKRGKLKVDDWIEIDRLLSSGESMQDVAKRFRVDPTAISFGLKRGVKDRLLPTRAGKVSSLAEWNVKHAGIAEHWPIEDQTALSELTFCVAELERRKDGS